jgi:DNA-binding transcriptional LysR family regulator
MLGLVAAGFGVTIVTQSLRALKVDGVVYRPIAAEHAVSRLWLIRAGEPSTVARSFIRMLRDRES